MHTRNSKLVIAVFSILWGCSAFCLSTPVHIYGGSFDLPIPSEDDPLSEYGMGWMSEAVIDIGDHLMVYDVDVAITITHSKVFDLQIFLQGPGGERICLNMYDPYTGFFHGENYTQTIFDDEAGVAIEDGECPFSGRFRPMTGNLLEVFDGQDAFGEWRLQIYDAYQEDVGALESFELIVTVPEPATFIMLALGLLMSRDKRRKL